MRRVCHPRTARRSGDTSNQPNRSIEESWDPSTLEPSNNLDTIVRWPTTPITPTSNAKPSQAQVSNKLPPNNIGQDFLHSVFAQSPGNINDSLSPTRQPFTDMEIDGDIYTPDDNEFLLMEGMDYPLDFSIPLMPNFTLPIDELPNKNKQSNLEAHQASALIVSDLGRASGSSLGADWREAGSQSDRTTPDPSCQSPNVTLSRSGNSVPEHKAVFAAQDRWSYFQCNPPGDSGPFSKTAIIYLEGLEHALESEDAWHQKDWQSPAIDPLYNGPGLQVEPFSSYAREKLVAVTQAIFQKALDTHHINSYSQRSAKSKEGRGFITLPPPIVLEYFLKAYVRRCEPFYACVPAGSLRPKEVMQAGNAKASCLLLLLMIAQGAAATPTTEARSLSSGLTEACRISLHDLLEKDFELVQNLIVLQCGLLCTNVAVWSGDKWHMEVSFWWDGAYQLGATDS